MQEVILTTSFSLNMLPPGMFDAEIDMRRLSKEEVCEVLDRGEYSTAVFREEQARILSRVLGRPIERKRRSIMFEDNVTLIVAQYNGPKLDEDAEEMPPNGHIAFFQINHAECGEAA